MPQYSKKNIMREKICNKLFIKSAVDFGSIFNGVLNLLYIKPSSKVEEVFYFFDLNHT